IQNFCITKKSSQIKNVLPYYPLEASLTFIYQSHAFYNLSILCDTKILRISVNTAKSELLFFTIYFSRVYFLFLEIRLRSRAQTRSMKQPVPQWHYHCCQRWLA